MRALWRRGARFGRGLAPGGADRIERREILNGLSFRREKKIARLHDPRKNFALAEIESEIRFDPLTGATGRICHFAISKLPAPDLGEIVSSSRGLCPFCPGKIEAGTPRFPEELVPGGRVRHGEAQLFPNLFPYDDLSAVAILCREHFHPMEAMPETLIRDGLGVARDFFALASGKLDAPRAFGLATWNYMPPAGASQVHPHLQVVLTSHPGNALERQFQGEQAHFARSGRCYWQDLLEEEERRGERWIGRENNVAWIAPYVPVGLLGDCLAVFPGRATLLDLTDADIEAFALSLSRVLRGFAERGLWSFNLSFFPDAFGAASGARWLTARLLPRFYLNAKLHVVDCSYLHLLLEEKLGMVYPEETAALLRGAFGPGVHP